MAVPRQTTICCARKFGAIAMRQFDSVEATAIDRKNVSNVMAALIRNYSCGNQIVCG
jgi:hypothetical protein